ncbi:hypothetical protein [Cellulomonas sp. P24]|uniref:hypothetical protein n=1 Tax=Cellulomonas sp. P24 TaxID=2885206 RepID=UPI00216AC3EB|nr:hypothetical protein [Cellulomonas sp. P24]MCR6493635.1 hypothetical protein [Cellulomonas sp. P24]
MAGRPTADGTYGAVATTRARTVADPTVSPSSVPGQLFVSRARSSETTTGTSSGAAKGVSIIVAGVTDSR